MSVEVNKDVLKGGKNRWAHELNAFRYVPYVCVANKYKIGNSRKQRKIEWQTENTFIFVHYVRLFRIVVINVKVHQVGIPAQGKM